MSDRPVLRRASRTERAMRRLGWKNAPDHTLRGRLWSIAVRSRPWWDWGHPLMAITGRAFCGNFDPPRGRDMWYREDPDSGHMVTTYSYDDVRGGEDWKIFDVQDDGFTVKMGYYGGGFYGLDRQEQRMFLRWFLVECKLRGEWLGLRRWLYYRGLHAAVNGKAPFSCQVTPPKRSGGYSHWHCQLPRKHTGPHRFNSYVWSHTRGQVEHDPA